MRPGKSCTNRDAPGVCEGLCMSLRLAHSVGILHCDLRLSNVLQFGTNDFQLVDFGLSCTVEGEDNDPYDLRLGGGSQASGVGPRLRQLLQTGGRVVWTADDDFEMLLQMLGAFRNGLEPQLQTLGDWRPSMPNDQASA